MRRWVSHSKKRSAVGLGEETVRSHFKKAQAKLGTRNRTRTVAEALRDLIKTRGQRARAFST